MDEWYRERTLKTGEAFSSESRLNYIDIWQYDGKPSAVARGWLHGDEVDDWLSQSGKFQDRLGENGAVPTSALRILESFQTQYRGNTTLFPLPITRATFEKISDQLPLPRSYLHTLSTAATVYTRTLSRRPDLETFIFQNNSGSKTYFSAAISHNRNTRRTRVFLHGLRVEEHTEILKILANSREYIASPVLVPLLLIEIRAVSTKKFVDRSTISLREIEAATGIRPAFLAGSSLKSQQSQGPIDFATVSRDLTSVSARLAICYYTSEIHVRMLDFIGEVLQDSGGPEKPRFGPHRLVQAELEEKRALIRCWLKELSSRSRYLSEQVQVQVQTIYSAMARHDSALNLQVAEDSRLVALAASRDSAAMKLIATVTMVFLPATFTATLFSTSFFDFRADRSESVTTWWFWLYWVTTVPITVIILLVWRHVYKRKEADILKQFDTRKPPDNPTEGPLKEA